MLKHWEEAGPPVYVAAAAYLGLIKPKKSKGSTEAGNLNDLLKMAGPGGIIH
jgi:hypothetical protein